MLTISSGSLYGVSIMKFALTYDGELRSNGDPKRKWAIRSQFHPQLQELWSISPALRLVEKNRIIPESGGFGSTFILPGGSLGGLPLCFTFEDPPKFFGNVDHRDIQTLWNHKIVLRG